MSDKKKDRIKVDGVEGFDGEYAFDATALNMDDLEYIETEAGVAANEFDDALARGSVRLLRVITTIALRDAGHPHWRQFRQAWGKVKLVGGSPVQFLDGDEETDAPADPPPAP